MLAIFTSTLFERMESCKRIETGIAAAHRFDKIFCASEYIAQCIFQTEQCRMMTYAQQRSGYAQLWLGVSKRAF